MPCSASTVRPPVCGDEVQARSRHQRGQALHEFLRRHHDVRGTVTPGALDFEHDVARTIASEPLVGDRQVVTVRHKRSSSLR